MTTTLAHRLLAWYRRGHRAMPWRGETDPYRIWVSEVMLQQTQVDTVLPYYQRWIELFPTVISLAQAPEQAVLAAWEGLGYYSRARHLHQAARQVVTELGGQLPQTAVELRRLPGIGRYTAAAIASLAFGADEAVLDGNVKRVLARIFNLEDDVKSPAGEKRLWALAQSLIPPGETGDYNQAIMDLGAVVCRPRNPACAVCPVQTFCEAYRLGVQLERPVMRPRVAPVVRLQSASVIWKRSQVLLVQRTDALLQGLWAFPTEASPEADLERTVHAAWGLTITVGPQVQTVTHTYSHFRVEVQVYECQWRAGRRPPRTALRWVPVSELPAYPMGKVDRLIALGIAQRGRPEF